MGAACARRGTGAPPVTTEGGPGRKGAEEAATQKPSRTIRGDAAQRLLGVPDGGTGGAPAVTGRSSAPARAGAAAKRSDDVAATSCASSVLLDYTEELRALERRREDCTERASEKIREIFGPDARLTKAASVNGRLVYVVDGAIPEEVRGQLYDCLQTDAFRRTEFARPDTREYRHHVVEYNVDKLRRTELFQAIDRLVDMLFRQEKGAMPLNVYRIYTNAIQFGDAAFVHRDSCEQEHVTALMYPNPEWAPEFGGETVFYDESGEIVEAVEPQAGRLVLFRGCILHKGSPPTRLFWGTRYTTAFKFAPEEERPARPPVRRSMPPLEPDDGDLPPPPEPATSDGAEG